MSFGEQDDEILTIELKELVQNKERILSRPLIANIIPILVNYELNAGLVFKLAVIPFAYDVSVGEVYSDFRPNQFQLRDHLDISENGINGQECLAFSSEDYKRVRNVIDLNDF